MNKKPIALYYRTLKYQPQNLDRLLSQFELLELENPSQDMPGILGRIEVLFAPLGYLVDRRKIDSCPFLKVIASNTTGHPHIDVEYAQFKGIAVACLKFAPDFLRQITPTAELTWGLIISLTRHLIPAHRAAVNGSWDRRMFGAPAMLSKMALGIVGHGRLGSMVANYGKAFGMKVRYYDPFVDSSTERAERCSSIEELVGSSDVVSLHIPHERETEGMISREVFARFKPGSYLINTARGELIDWDALLDSLKSGKLAGAALDVFEGEFHPGFLDKFSSHPLLEYAREYSNLILTPHIGGSTKDAWALTEAHTIDMVLEVLKENTEKNVKTHHGH